MTKLGTGAGTIFYHYNARGDVVAATDESGNVVARYTYDAWGNILEQRGAFADDNPYRYAGYRFDKETGLYYLMARYYNPKHGNFLSLDPDPGDSDDPITQNGYTYANNNPVMGIDPDGNWVWVAFNAGFAAYEAYGMYKSGASWKKIAAKTAVNTLGGPQLRGIMGSYSAVRKVIKGSGLEAHHVIEKRLVRGKGVNERSMLSISLSEAEHDNYTNRWRKAIPYGMDYRTLRRKDILKAINVVYKDSRELRVAATREARKYWRK